MTPLHPTLLDAIANGLQVTFRYHSENSTVEEATDRIVEPWIYGTKNLYGYQVDGGESGIRRFDMRRVKSVRLTGDHIQNIPTAKADVTKWDKIFESTSKISEKTL